MHFTYGSMNERYVVYSEIECVNSWNCKKVITSLYDVTNDYIINTHNIAQAANLSNIYKYHMILERKLNRLSTSQV